MRILSRENHIRHAEREIVVMVCGNCAFQNPPCMASREVMFLRIAAPGTSFSPLPCQALHDYTVTNAHRVKVEVIADGPPSAPPSGAAVAPRAGAPI
jgi:hypothetical protein